MITNTEMILDLNPELNNIIKVVGVGGAGGNAILYMIETGFTGVDFIACNADNQALKSFPEHVVKLQLGAELTKGLGAGTDSAVGRQAAIESEKAIKEVLGGATEMVFITAGMGGGTGTGAAPEIARISKELKKLTVAVVTYPFSHEGGKKIEQAEEGIAALKECCDTVLVIKNDRLIEMYGDLGLAKGYKKADEVLANSVTSIAELITRPGVINADFADVKTVLGQAGHAVMGSAEAEGDERALKAIEAALTSPLLENNDIGGARKILMTIAYSDELPEYELKLSDQGIITKYIENKIKAKANIFKHGFSIDKSLKARVRVTVIAAEFDKTVAASNPTVTAPNIVKGAGISNIFSTQSVPVIEAADTQVSLFEEEGIFYRNLKNMLKSGYNISDMQTPAYKRYGVILEEVQATDSEINYFPLDKVYQKIMS
jgi:cell division protein FtsZ